MQPLDLPLDMDDWQPSSSTERRQTIFENALFSFASILCTVDHLNHTDAVKPNKMERKMPTSLELMQLKNEDELINSRYSILVNVDTGQVSPMVFLSYTRFLGFPEFSGYHQWQQESQ